MKRFTALLLALALALPMAACTDKTTPKETAGTTGTSEPAVTTAVTEPVTEPATDVPGTSAPETKLPETKAPETSVPETKAPETSVPETKAPETSAPETKAPETSAPETKAPETKTPETEPVVEPVSMSFEIDGKISEQVLRNYLSRAVTISCENGEMKLSNTAMFNFIINTGAKYIARANTEWSPSAANDASRPIQKEFIDAIHKIDPDVVFEACIFECVSTKVNEIKIPSYVFKAFGKTPEDRNFSFEKMKFRDGKYTDQWGEGTAVPDITQGETMMFFYYRACEFIKAGFEGLHMGQVELMGQKDTNCRAYTRLFGLIRKFAEDNARRGFVFLNAHTHGLVGSDGVLLFDFHGYPLRAVSIDSEGAHLPTEDFPQGVELRRGARGSIYGNSKGGKTYSGWECTHLPYLVEYDNYGVGTAKLNEPDPNCLWGMDEITWFANQPASYRRQWIRYAVEWVREKDKDGYVAMPGMRIARIYDAEGNILSWQYKAFADSFGDEETIKAVWDEFFPLKKK